MLLWQLIASYVFIFIGFLIPICIYNEYGLSNGNLYNQDGAVIGSVNYLLIGLGLGLFAVSISIFSIKMARRSLKELRSKWDGIKGDGGN